MGLSVTINITGDISSETIRKVMRKLARIEESVQRLEAAYGEMATRISDDVTELKGEISALVAKVDELTEQDTARLSALADRIDSTATGMQAIDPVSPVVPDPDQTKPVDPGTGDGTATTGF